MNLKDLDIIKLRKYVTHLLDSVTCINCCKFYLVPTTATCGHTLCHTCWRIRRSCPTCATEVDKKALRLNSPLQSLTEHVIKLRHTFESLFDIQLDYYTMDTDEQQHVKEWLASSENQFSAPVTSSQQCSEETVKPAPQKHLITSEIQVHTINQKVKVPARQPIKLTIQQDDWDKIEEMPEIETNKSLENAVGPMDIETFNFLIDDEDYSANNPRRSSRNKELQSSKPPITNDVSSDKESGKNFNMNSDNKFGQSWKNVKRMRKEFSKLNKKNKNKLNISIEMCKKAKLAVNKGALSNSQQVSHTIDENTPDIAAIGDIVTKNTGLNNDHRINTDISKTLQCNALSTDNISNKTALAQIHVNHKDLDLQNKSIEKIEQNNQNLTASKVSFFKKGPLLNQTSLQTTYIDTNKTHVINVDNPNVKNKNTDKVGTGDIEIIIKIGNTLTNICIQKKENEVQYKIKTDREVQTSLGNSVVENEDNMQSLVNHKKQHNIETDNTNNVVKVPKGVPVSTQHHTSKAQIDKSMSPKKNTTSADTSTACFEISASEEKEFADHMTNAPFVNKQGKSEFQKSLSKPDCTITTTITTTTTISTTTNTTTTSKSKNDQLLLKNMEIVSEDLEFLNDFDIFDAESVKEANIQSLKSTKSMSSAIIMPTIKSKSTSQKKTNKRDRDMYDTEELSNNKKSKISQGSFADKKTEQKVLEENNVKNAESENINYDAIMSKVFANINADMENLPKTGTSSRMCTQISNTQKSNINNFAQPIKPNIKQDNKNKTCNQTSCKEADQKCSENVFTLLDKEEGNFEIFETTFHKSLSQTQHRKDNVATEREPIVHMAIENKVASPNNMDIVEYGTPMQDDDDKSVVEETPQKNTSFVKTKSKNEAPTSTDNAVAECHSLKKDKSFNETSKQQKDKDDSMIVISVSDSAGDVTEGRKTTLETPLTINKFVNKITCNSTPLAKKSLDFSSQNADNDPEETICPSAVVVAKTTQEREFMNKAFEHTLEPISQTLCAGMQRRRAKFCVAGSCLMASEQAMLKQLCFQMNWTYVDKYTKDLTHLVVGVDKENRSQRSVKYMCALASSKWIVTFAWVERCLSDNGFVDEEPFEALDAMGEPAPRRSRLAKTKLLQGITFYCMGPFSIIGIDTLKDVLEAAGGRVVDDPRDLQACRAPAMLLAEPENTQESRFTYLAMTLKIVPMNYEWVLNCLGTYTLKPIFDLLLCPATLLPSAISNWPSELISSCDD
ncbi:breast cancer type 1 susceptibility protein homolog isoform X2 [Maniola jurtina]|uniref:breast cancer type 1 susceptibility protein homolog isoform X2 n=1 Tax=Maniola jurtina TaxID=191418 RepID=UPI001E686016|nr:breast cancer type 1 susceptibility protein homolog isoform X2 [Maniola jurtina]